MDEKDLKKYMDENNIPGKLIELPLNMKTTNIEKDTEQAEKALGINREETIKSIVLRSNEGEPIIAIIDIDSRVDIKKVAKIIGSEVRLATPVEVEKYTGYKVGGVPPIGHKSKIKTIMDEKVFENEKVYGGGGSYKHLLEISPHVIQDLQNAIVADIAKR
jgi:Cys-tRNA(Pro) deacylase